MFICFACSEAGALTDLVSHVAELDFFASMRLIGSFADAAPELDIEKMLEEKENTFDQNLVTRLHEDIQKSDVAIEYLESRGISIRSMLDFRIGFSEARKMITIPLMNPEGEYVGFVGRSIDPKAEKRFQNFKGMDRTGCLFNLENNRDTREVFVVEASIDAIRIHQAGFPVVATLGILSKGQALLLNKYFDIVHFIPDNAKDGSGPDVTGRKTFAKAERLCTASIDMVTLPIEFKDAGDMTDEQIKSVLSEVVQ